MAAGEIARALHCPASTLSFHLKELSRADVLEARTRGRFVIYAMQPAVLAELLLWLGQEGDGPPLDAVALAEGGLVRPLPAALRVATVRPVVAALLDAESRSLVGLFEHLRVGTLEPERWRVLDPDGASLRDVDTPADLPRG